MRHVIYQGEDFDLVGNVEFTEGDPSRKLDDYDVGVRISTTPQGVAYLAHTDDKGTIQAEVLDDNRFMIRLSYKETMKMAPGQIVLSVGFRLKHTYEPLRMIDEVETNVWIKSARIKATDL